MYCKYIILRENFSPILFHSGIEHIVEAQGREVRSAGFVRIDFTTGEVSCFGGSTSLGGILVNLDLDHKLIKKMLSDS